jgi:hypothetical protein
MPLSPGTRLGRCEILAPVGAGGMGVRTVSYTNQAGFRRAFGLRVTADLKSYAERALSGGRARDRRPLEA